MLPSIVSLAMLLGVSAGTTSSPVDADVALIPLASGVRPSLGARVAPTPFPDSLSIALSFTPAFMLAVTASSHPAGATGAHAGPSPGMSWRTYPVLDSIIAFQLLGGR